MSHFSAPKMPHLPTRGREAGSVSVEEGKVCVSLGAVGRGVAGGESTVIGREKRVLARHYLNLGLSRREVSRRLEVSRRTLGRWLASGDLVAERQEEPVRYRDRRSGRTVLDGYREWIEGRLSAYPALSAVRLYRDLREAGYRGGYDQVRRYAREVRPGPVREPVVRFETRPGLQAQVDFAEFPLPWGKRHALLVVLGYSRQMWFQFYPEQTQEVVMRGLSAAFRFFGAVPAEVLFDQMKAVIVSDGRVGGGKLLRNPEFLRFAGHWGFRIRACRPYRAQTKGKVERAVGYIRRGFFYAGEFASDEDLNARALRWLEEVAQERIHGTTKEKPVERFRRERPHLGPLPGGEYRSVSAPGAGGGAPRGAEERPRRVAVERRPLSEYGRLAEEVG